MKLTCLNKIIYSIFLIVVFSLFSVEFTPQSIVLASADDIAMSLPTTDPCPDSTFASSITIDVGSQVLGAYELRVTYDPTVVIIMSITGSSTTAGLNENTFFNSATFTSGSTKIVSFQNTSLTEPTGIVNIANIIFKAVGDFASHSTLDLIIDIMSDTHGNDILTNVISGSVTICEATVPSGGGGGSGGRPHSTSTTTKPSPLPTTTTTTIAADVGEDTSTTTSIEEPAPDETTTTTTAKERRCPFRKVLGEGKQANLDVIRNFRDRRLAKSTVGLSLVYLYYAHSEETTDILSSNPSLLTKARELTLEIVPTIKSDLETDGEITLTKTQYLKGVELMKLIQKEASSGLRKNISFILEKLDSGELQKEIGLKIEGD